MILLTNGCSWTWGGGIDRQYPDKTELDQLTWPKHLADLLGCEEFYNLAAGGGSNQRILRTTLDWILYQPKHVLENTIAVIQWTEESRYEYYVQDDFNVEYENDQDRWVRVKLGNVIPLELNDHYQLSQDRIKYQNSKIQNVYSYINNCNAMANMLSTYGIKYYFWDFTDSPKYFPEPFKQYLLNNFKWLQHPKYLDAVFGDLDPWQHWEYERLDNDPHPSINGHKELAKHIFDAMEIINNDAE